MMNDPLPSEQSQDRVPWSIQQTLTGIALTLVPWFVIIFGLNSIGANQPTRTTPLSPRVDLSSAVLTFILSALIEAAFIIAPLIIANRSLGYMKEHGGLALQALGFRKTRAGQTLSWTIILMAAIFVVNILYQYLITALHLNIQTNDQVLLEQSKYAPLSTYATLLVATFIAPICEEIFFRGFALMGFARAMPLPWAIVLSSLIFAVAHGDPGSFPVLFIIGLALAFLRLHTRSLWPSILLHMVNNGLGAVLLVLTMQGVIH